MNVALIVGDYGIDRQPVVARSRTHTVVFADRATPGDVVRRFIDRVAPGMAVETFIVGRRKAS